MLLQAEAMLEQQFQHDGRSDSPFISSPSPPNMKEIKDNHFEKNGKSEKEELWKKWDANGPMSPMPTVNRDIDPSSSIPQSNKKGKLGTKSATTSSRNVKTLDRYEGSSSDHTYKTTSENLVIKHPKEKDLCAELANRLEVKTFSFFPSFLPLYYVLVCFCFVLKCCIQNRRCWRRMCK